MRAQVSTNGENVTPSDSDTITPGTLFVGIEGTIRVTLLNMPLDEYLEFQGVQGDFPRVVKKVWATGTTAGGIIVDTE